jgi:hypothetical protein
MAARVKTWSAKYWRIVPAVVLLVLIGLPLIAQLPAGNDVIYPLHLLSQSSSHSNVFLFRLVGMLICIFLLAQPIKARVGVWGYHAAIVILGLFIVLELLASSILSSVSSQGYVQLDSLQVGNHHYHLDGFLTLSDGNTLYFYQCDSGGVICTLLEEFSTYDNAAHLTSNGQTVTIEAGGRRLYSILPQD